MPKRWLGLVAVIVALLAVVGFWLAYRIPDPEPKPVDTQPETVQASQELRRVVINEAARTLLYLPLYHGIEKGFFKEEGLDVQVVTGGTATNSMAALLSGEADFAQADPMYVPISRSQGARVKVVGQIVGRIGIWGVAVSPGITDMSPAAIKGRKISTHPRPMTAYTYTVKMVRDAGLAPDQDVEIIQSKPGTELVPLLNQQADFAVTVEPNVSTAQAEGAHVVQSFPELFGDQVLSGLIVREDYLKSQRATVLAVARAYNRSLIDIHANPGSAATSAETYFAQLKPETIRSAVRQMVDEQVVPKSIAISAESWNKAVAIRVEAGDLKAPSPLEENCATDIIREVSK